MDSCSLHVIACFYCMKHVLWNVLANVLANVRDRAVCAGHAFHLVRDDDDGGVDHDHAHRGDSDGGHGHGRGWTSLSGDGCSSISPCDCPCGCGLSLSLVLARVAHAALAPLANFGPSGGCGEPSTTFPHSETG